MEIDSLNGFKANSLAYDEQGYPVSSGERWKNVGVKPGLLLFRRRPTRQSETVGMQRMLVCQF
ncbi:hypothetical protein N7539_002175 [Penicillium diatomitis]|uniref:Uncharacterized protein n=1 Tax=Penicillium diatomitis TaxID=2819901 RepID=A0A9W9XJD2_9EURO|nr:uncharacterized protein N7539_002175 [Penicillium diatomitis]KAJ5493429.1 hypothetical protein N7539_002175 [Penicillium diatomitis]